MEMVIVLPSQIAVTFLEIFENPLLIRRTVRGVAAAGIDSDGGAAACADGDRPASSATLPARITGLACRACRNTFRSVRSKIACFVCADSMCVMHVCTSCVGAGVSLRTRARACPNV